jgi:hypothetical protein
LDQQAQGGVLLEDCIQVLCLGWNDAIIGGIIIGGIISCCA